MKASSETIKAAFNPETAFDIELYAQQQQRMAVELQEALLTQQSLPRVPRELELRGRPESALHD